mmetsp:Transcript_20346/g.24400  ORF Transcript_20346/g.24400 Transcript_20346/m.24400 type:complete len:144 (+) Transcript_20346:204-635(+)|eukprot:CAMPEP_0197847162 /NCGR_PEP_ID=MMETSP1438-20131217/5361_1 /TAXON_ID=1461541 /ORGANISM="Pterosperma sp., Strain CCMP1384" /LENGTH=143 /DNA_ID=CAMNT_0043459009 /DNA_START=194 /DNA_END=625 /DNA_ORIENTATION=-
MGCGPSNSSVPECKPGESIGATRQSVKNESDEQKALRKLFDELDVDRSGSIRIDELIKSMKDGKSRKSICTTLKIEDAGRAFTSVFNTMDEDGDRQVTFDEFSAKCHEAFGATLGSNTQLDFSASQKEKFKPTLESLPSTVEE